MNLAYLPQRLLLPESLYRQPMKKRELFPAYVRMFIEEQIYEELKKLPDFNAKRYYTFCTKHIVDIFRSSFGSVESIHVFLDDGFLGTFHWNEGAGSVKFTRYFHVPE